MRNFLRTVIWSSEKAACLARACRDEKDLFELLVEEKTGEDKNSNTAHDFKTLADVLIQETVRHDIGQRYPQLADNIFGEESNKFTNTLGESIGVKVCETQAETSVLLGRVLDDRPAAADILAKLVHSQPDGNGKLDGGGVESLGQVPDDDSSGFDDLGIWIDPIDSTNNYIHGKSHDGEVGGQEVASCGLRVVTVLIGIFDRRTGATVAGVVNQPFAAYDAATKTWKGKVHWGCVIGDNKFTSFPLTTQPSAEEGLEEKLRVVVSVAETAELIEKLEAKFQVFRAGGAGYKILVVFLGLVDVYVTSKDSTYKWDTCAGHGLLRSQGGNCMDFVKPNAELSYKNPIEDSSGIKKWCNNLGVIAYRNFADAQQVLAHIEETSY